MNYTNAIKGLERPSNKLKPCPWCNNHKGYELVVESE